MALVPVRLAGMAVVTGMAGMIDLAGLVDMTQAASAFMRHVLRSLERLGFYPASPAPTPPGMGPSPSAFRDGGDGVLPNFDFLISWYQYFWALTQSWGSIWSLPLVLMAVWIGTQILTFVRGIGSVIGSVFGALGLLVKLTSMVGRVGLRMGRQTMRLLLPEALAGQTGVRQGTGHSGEDPCCRCGLSTSGFGNFCARSGCWHRTCDECGFPGSPGMGRRCFHCPPEVPAAPVPPPPVQPRAGQPQAPAADRVPFPAGLGLRFTPDAELSFAQQAAHAAGRRGYNFCEPDRTVRSGVYKGLPYASLMADVGYHAYICKGTRAGMMAAQAYCRFAVAHEKALAAGGDA